MKEFARADIGNGLIAGLMSLTLSIASISLIIPPSLSAYMSLGVYAVLMSTLVGGMIITYKTNVTFLITCTVTPLAALTGQILVNISNHTPAAHLLPTLIISIAFITLIVSCCAYLAGKFHVSFFIQYVPYPVMGGFILGTTWIICLNALKLMGSIGQQAQLSQTSFLELFYKYIPGILLGFILYLITKYIKKSYILPLCVAMAAILVHLFLHYSNTAITQQLLSGWFYSKIDMISAFGSLSTYTLSDINWLAIFNEWGDLLGLILITIFTQIFNLSSVEYQTKRRVDFDDEIESIGIANFFSGILGGAINTISISATLMNYRTGSLTRVSSVVANLFCATALIFSQYIITNLPKPILASLLLCYSISMFDDWLIKSWSRLPKIDYFILLVIFAIIINYGMTDGILIGLLLSSAQFIYEYSKTPIIRYVLSGDTKKSRRNYPISTEKLLNQERNKIHVIKLQGHLFFGSCAKLLSSVERLIKYRAEKPIRFLVVDFQEVTGLDVSAYYSLSRLKAMTDENDIQLIYSHITSITLRNIKLMESVIGKNGVKFMSSLDDALEYAEGILIREYQQSPSKVMKDHLAVFSDLFTNEASLVEFFSHLDEVFFQKGEVIFNEHEASDSMYFIASGKVSAYLQRRNAEPLRIFTSESGTIIGEMGFFTGHPRSATVNADEDSVTYRLTSKVLMEMIAKEPLIVSEFYHGIIILLSERLEQINKELSML